MYTKGFIFFVLIGLMAFAQPPELLGDEVIEIHGPGEINWTQHTIKAKGWGVIDTTVPLPQAKLMAMRAAQVVAQRNLLEIIKGVMVVSETKVHDFMTQSDYIYTRIEGVVKGARMIGDPVEDDGVIQVEFEISIYDAEGIAPPLQEALEVELAKQDSLTEEEKKEIEKITGFAIDAIGTGIKPAVFPKILDEQNNVLFDAAKYYDPDDPKVREFLKTLILAKENREKLDLGENAYIIKAIMAKNSDLVVSNDEVKKVKWFKKAFHTVTRIAKALWILL